MYIIHSAFVPFRVHENSQESIDTLSIKNESSISAKINQAFKNNGSICDVEGTIHIFFVEKTLHLQRKVYFLSAYHPILTQES